MIAPSILLLIAHQSPCPEVRVGDLVESELRPSQELRLEVVVAEPDVVRFELRSWAFDGTLRLIDAKGETVAEDDDGWVGTQPRITAELTPGSRHAIVVSAKHGGSGAFSLWMRSGEAPTPSWAERKDADIADARGRLEWLESRPERDGLALGLANERLGWSLLEDRKLDEALAHFERSALEHETDGTDRIALSRALDGSGRTLVLMGRSREAVDFHRRSLAIREELLGAAHADLGATLSCLAHALNVSGDVDGAFLAYERSLRVREAGYGPEDPRTLTTLNNLGDLYRKNGDPTAARPLLERCLEARERVLGSEHPSTLATRSNLGLVLLAVGELQHARSELELALEGRREHYGDDHLLVGQAHSNLATCLVELRDPEAALFHYGESLRIHERLYGPSSPRVAARLGGMSNALHSLGRLDEAAALRRRAGEVYEAAWGREDARFAVHLNNLGVVEHERGDLDAARTCFEEALAIDRARYGPRHERVATTLGNLGDLLREIDLDGSRRCLDEALSIREERLGPDHPRTIAARRRLATTLGKLGRHEEAVRGLEDVLSSSEATLGPEHSRTADALLELGRAVVRSGRHPGRAREMLERARGIYARSHGPDHPRVASALSSLSQFERGFGDLAAAERAGEAAFAILESALGPTHPDTIRNAASLARIHADRGDTDSALALLTAKRPRRIDHLRRVLLTLSEREAYAYLDGFHDALALEIDLAAEHGDATAERAAYEGLLAWKGQVTRLAIESRERLFDAITDQEREIVGELRSCQRWVAALPETGDGQEPDGTLPEDLERLRRERERLELELRRAVRPEPSGPLDARGLAQALPERSAFLDFFVHGDWRRARSESGVVVERGRWSAPRLSAWITRPRRDTVRVDLGPAAPIESAARTYLEEVAAGRGASRGLGSIAGDGASRAAAPLRAALWDPLADRLEGVDTLFVSPDDFLGALPLEVLRLADGSFLIEHFACIYVQDPARLLERGIGGTLDSIVAVGGIELDPGAWPELPGTAEEAEQVVALHRRAFPDGRRSHLTGADPDEARLASELPGHAIIHLATHGFFRPPEDAVDEDGGPARALRGRRGLRSGLVCAGRGGAGELLTAEDVAWLDLSKAELVVLSACETGLGEERSGEGLIGLRRAFEVAGAKTVVSSMWRVDDAATSELMRAFYENLWAGRTRSAALREAQLAMLRRNRTERGAPLPGSWGAFVLAGEWR